VTDLYINNQLALLDLDMIMLDKDGTIIDIHHYWGSMIKMRADLIVQHFFPTSEDRYSIKDQLIEVMGIDLKSGKMKPEGPVGIKPREYIAEVASEVVRKNKIKKHPEEIEEIFKIVDQKTVNNISPLLTILPLVENFLKRCKECNVQLAIVTTDQSERARTALKALSIDHFFDHVIGGNEVKNVKPAPDMANKIIEISGIKKEKIAVIGDHSVDIQMGLNAGISCNIGVLSGLGSKNDFQSMSCWVINSFKDIEVK
jgi:phosphoglycolate phosphatase